MEGAPGLCCSATQRRRSRAPAASCCDEPSPLKN
ncbi:hypothetical protein NC652_021985 [Populus alba x Populus x berolinensis]|nr:hypothetical protein NC652_021985 [Populus alba x Populus x berolinensis]